MMGNKECSVQELQIFNDDVKLNQCRISDVRFDCRRSYEGMVIPTFSPLDTGQKSVLTIAGSDSGGGAGIQADIKTIAAHGCYGTSAITALTAQNTIGVQGVHPSPPAFVAQQIKSVLNDIPIHAIKTGMLFDADIISSTVAALEFAPSGLPPLVCDPVCISTSGHKLLEPSALKVLVNELFPLAKLITPNKAEAEMLLAQRSLPSRMDTLENVITASLNLLQLGSEAALLKGGHLIFTHKEVHKVHTNFPSVDVVCQGLLRENMEILKLHSPTLHSISKLVIDVLCEGSGKVTLFVRPHLDSKNTHGTGCTLSAAIACNLARGLSLKEAVKNAIQYTHLGIQTGYSVGEGPGPLNHFHVVVPRIVPRPTQVDKRPLTRMLIEGSAKTWKAYVEHDFVKLLGQGILSREAFIYFIIQDYIYLKYYARAHALLAAKSNNYTSIQSTTRTILNILAEVERHKMLCMTFEIDPDMLDTAREASETTAYGSYLIDIGIQGDSTKLLIALLACLLGYGEVGLWLRRQALLPDTWVRVDDNPYRPWMDEYAGEVYQSVVQLALDHLESEAVADPPSPARFEEWRVVWERCTRFEKEFWDAAMAAAVITPLAQI